MSEFKPLKPGPQCDHEHLSPQELSERSLELALLLSSEIGTFCAEASQCRVERAILAAQAMTCVLGEIYDDYQGTALPAVLRDSVCRRLSWSIVAY